MKIASNDHTGEAMRIANFTPLKLSLEHVLKFNSEKDTPGLISELRKYADLPYAFIFSADQKHMITDLLTELKDIRSICFPYVLFYVDELNNDAAESDFNKFGTDFIKIENRNSGYIERKIADYAQDRLVFDNNKLKFDGLKDLPKDVDVLIVGSGVTGLYAATRLLKNNVSFCVVDKQEIIGGIWSSFANRTSRVNTSEGGYRIIEKEFRTNRDHSATREILEDLVQLAESVSDHIYLNMQVEQIEKNDGSYLVSLRRNLKKFAIRCNGIILAINDRVGTPREIDWNNQNEFKGKIISGISDDAEGIDWSNKKVAIIGMGAFAVENVRTALEGGASHVTVVGRRHGTVCPQIIDFLNFTMPYDENFKHDKKSNIRNMLLWKKLYDQSGATQPECWMGKVKHDGHTISVSDIWFIGHYLKKIQTVIGGITGMYENGIIVENHQRIAADLVVNCVGFHRNARNIKKLTGYEEIYNINYIDKDFMYLSDAYIDDDAFNSFFGSSVLEMVKFYLEVFLYFFNQQNYHEMIKTDGIEKIEIEDRSWSHYIDGAAALIHQYPHIYDKAKKQILQRTKNFAQVHDLQTYIAANKREWIDTHSFLAGVTMKEEDCLPYVFQKLIDKKY